MSGLRARVAVIRKDRHIDSEWVGRKNKIQANGKWWYVVRGSRYAAMGPYFTFSFRLARSAGLRRYVGVQRIYLEGNPTPIDFHDQEAQVALLGDTARLIAEAADSDLPDRLLRPPAVPWILILLVAATTGMLGYVAGVGT
ncbi:MAG: hypothetical protein A3K59_00170 [Euryarchaeota archaeon RBG_19FT_COMBO_69_17]|nr:MAG: hypothetical protein A3K59_00170 [Euryarchaeota archaeon RBG_19FT_COMBO_69_17]